MHWKQITSALAPVIFVVALSASATAQKRTVPTSSVKASNAAKYGYVRIAHAVPDAPAADVYLGSKKVASGITFKTVTGYLPLPAGTHRITLTPVGLTRAVLELSVTVKPGQTFTAAAAGTLRTLRPVLISEEAALPTNKATRVRVIHLAPDAPAVDVLLVGSEARLLAKSVAFGKASPFTPIGAGDYTLEVRPAASPLAIKQNVALKVSAAGDLTVFAVGLLKGEGAQAFSVMLVRDPPPAK